MNDRDSLADLIDDVVNWPRTTTVGKGTNQEPNIFAYLPRGLRDVVADRLSGFGLSDKYVYGWAEGDKFVVLREDKGHENWNLSHLHLFHGHFGCGDCDQKAESVRKLVQDYDKFSFGAKGMRERLNTYLESASPDEAGGRKYPIFVRLTDARSLEGALDIRGSDLYSVHFLEILYCQAAFVTVARVVESTRTIEGENGEDDIKAEFKYPARVLLHGKDSPVLCVSPHECDGKFDLEKRRFLFRKHVPHKK